MGIWVRGNSVKLNINLSEVCSQNTLNHLSVSSLVACLLTFPKEDVQGKNIGDKIKQVKILRTLLYIEVIS